MHAFIINAAAFFSNLFFRLFQTPFARSVHAAIATMGDYIPSAGIGDSLTATQKAQLHEVADGMLKIYRTLERMQYLHPSWIVPGPHSIDALLPLYHSLGLDDSIIYLYSILPYVEAPGSYTGFFQGGYFADFRKEDDVRQGWDPFYSDNEDEMLLPWMTPLSMLGNHQTVIIYNAKTHWIGMFDQECGGSTDHALDAAGGAIGGQPKDDEGAERAEENPEQQDGGMTEPGQGEEKVGGKEDAEDEQEQGAGEEDDEAGKGEEEEDEEDGGGGDGDEDDEEEDEEDEEDEKEQGYWGEVDGRPAPAVLRDMVKWYEELIETPGGADDTPAEWDGEWVKEIYRKHGWPRETFGGEAFLVDLARALAADRVKESVEKPIMDVECRKDGLEYRRRTMKDAKTRLEHAQTVDEQWLARWEIHQTEKAIIKEEIALREAEKKMEELCPGGKIKNPEDIPLLELRALEREFRDAKGSLGRLEQTTKDLSTHDEARVREMKLEMELAEREALIAQKAYEAARRDADRLCPGRSPPSDEGKKPKNPPLDLTEQMADLNERINGLTKEIQSNQEWLSKIPEEAVEARERVERYLKHDRGWLSGLLEHREKVTKETGA